jgi:uncharacterized protein YkwD
MMKLLQQCFLVLATTATLVISERQKVSLGREWLQPDPDDLEITHEVLVPPEQDQVEEIEAQPEGVPVSTPSQPPAFTTLLGRPLILVPNCDPNRPRSSQLPRDVFTNCKELVDSCQRDGSTKPYDYDEAEWMLQKCFKTCSDHLPGGPDEFCSMVDVPRNQTPSMPYCSSEGQDRLWTSNMVENEDGLLILLNLWRAQGIVCPEAEFQPVPPVVRNPQLDCAARAQAKKIVAFAISNNGFNGDSPSLHDVCSGSNCDEFVERMEKAGYVEWWGSVNEVASYGRRTPLAGLEAWLGSTTGHCPVLMKQEWAHIQTEVGIGFYEDATTGHVSYVMVAGQQ